MTPYGRRPDRWWEKAFQSFRWKRYAREEGKREAEVREPDFHPRELPCAVCGFSEEIGCDLVVHLEDEATRPE